MACCPNLNAATRLSRHSFWQSVKRVLHRQVAERIAYDRMHGKRADAVVFPPVAEAFRAACAEEELTRSVDLKRDLRIPSRMSRMREWSLAYEATAKARRSSM